MTQSQCACAVLEGTNDRVFVDIGGDRDDRDVLARSIRRGSDIRKLQSTRGEVRQDQIRRVLGHLRFELRSIGRARRTHSDAAVSQHADQLFSFFDRILDQQ